MKTRDRFGGFRQSCGAAFIWLLTCSIVFPSVARSEPDAAPPTLDTLIQEALKQSPMITSARMHWQALTKVPAQVSTLPDPQVSLQHFTVGSPQPFSGYESSDFYYTGFGVSQDIPGPGKLRLQKSQAEKDAEYGQHRYEAAGREVEEKVKEIYFELFYHAKTLAILDRNQEELRQIQQIAQTKYRVGQGLQQDLIKAQLQTTEILKEHAMHHQEEDQETARTQATARAGSRLAEY
jgi:outer membrane protein, heavy metal efflux system